MNNITKYTTLVLLALSIAACKQSPVTDTMPETTQDVEQDDTTISLTQKQFKSSGYELGTLLKTPFDRKVRAIGSVVIPQKDKAIVSTLIDGKVGTYTLQKGQWVKKGQRLFEIVNPALIDMQQSYLTWTTEVDYLNGELRRMRALADEKLAPKNKVIELRAELDKAKASLASVDKKLDLYGIAKPSMDNPNFTNSISIYAPISGYISEIDIVEGTYMEAADHAITIVNTSRLRADLSVLEKDISTIKRGDIVHLSLANNPTVTSIGKVHLISQEMDGNAYTVTCAIENQKQLRAGAKVNGSIVVDKQISMSLPNDAIVQSEGRSYILVLTRKSENELVFEKVKIEVGQTTEEISEIISDQDLEGKEILVKGSYYLI